jgi:hypothetical protein
LVSGIHWLQPLSQWTPLPLMNVSPFIKDWSDDSGHLLVITDAGSVFVAGSANAAFMVRRIPLVLAHAWMNSSSYRNQALWCFR